MSYSMGLSRRAALVCLCSAHRFAFSADAGSEFLCTAAIPANGAPAAVVPCAASNGTSECRGVAKADRLWRNRTHVRVAFLDGSEQRRMVVANVAQEWSRHAALRWEFTSPDVADIRIAFELGEAGDWSNVGTDALLGAKDLPTMRLSAAAASSTDDRTRRVVLHEFGHALGLQHEHLSPHAPMDWDIDAVLKFTRNEYGWDEKKTRLNILDRVESERHLATEFDHQSIMLYPLPPILTYSRNALPNNTKLSPIDRQFIASLYPGLATESANEGYARGLAALRGGDAAGAWRVWQPLAQAGYADAQVAAAFLLHTGRGITRDVPAAVRLYRAADEQGSAPAASALGSLLLVGFLDVKAQPIEARALLRKGAERGSVEAMVALASAALDGIGGAVDRREASLWYATAARLGSETARNGLLRMR